MSDNIPIEIQQEIIKKVPVKSLLRFRSVSKQWKSFIDSPSFVAAYGARDTHPHRLLLKYVEDFFPSKVKYVSFLDDVTFPIQQQDFAPNVPDLVKQLKKVIGSSCGLWCLHNYNHSVPEMVVIWNPSIRKSVGIVVPRLLKNTSKKTTHFGFGVCPSTYDPTIVGIMNKPRQVGIFTLSSKAWKMMPSSNVPRESIEIRSPTQVAAGGFIFWVAYDRTVGNDFVSQYKSLIVSFDLKTHDFKEVHLPVRIGDEVSLFISISKLNESLVVSGYTQEVNDELVYGVWMMGEEGCVMPSFTKLFNIKTPDGSLVNEVLGFTMSGEPIMETEKDDGDDEEFATVEVYKPCSQHIHDLRINGEDGLFFICPYTETLLLVDHPDFCIISGDS